MAIIKVVQCKAREAQSSEKVPFEADPVSACLLARPTAWHLTLDAQNATENATAQLRGRQFSDRGTGTCVGAELRGAECNPPC